MAGDMRVVWERKKPLTTSKADEKYQVDKIPFLNIARSFGDFWSINNYLVSPMYVHYFDLKKYKFITLASDGFWNMLKPQEVVKSVYNVCGITTDESDANQAV